MAELTSKQRAQLRGLANSIDTILIVGKDGIGDNLVKQANDALEARELIKGRVLENSMLSPREAAEQLAPLTRSEVVQVIGTKFVLYRPSHNKEKKDRIVLVPDKKQRESILFLPAADAWRVLGGDGLWAELQPHPSAQFDKAGLPLFGAVHPDKSERGVWHEDRNLRRDLQSPPSGTPGRGKDGH